ncbi:MAG: histidine kinase [Lachnospiraceae bacterium]
MERQINPHFLFNTLEIINSLILGRKEKSADNCNERH